ncbi:hypothetical protein D3C84_1265340 [compost metagenome]
MPRHLRRAPLGREVGRVGRHAVEIVGVLHRTRIAVAAKQRHVRTDIAAHGAVDLVSS